MLFTNDCHKYGSLRGGREQVEKEDSCRSVDLTSDVPLSAALLQARKTASRSSERAAWSDWMWESRGAIVFVVESEAIVAREELEGNRESHSRFVGDEDAEEGRFKGSMDSGEFNSGVIKMVVCGWNLIILYANTL